MTFGLSGATTEKIRSVFARHPQVEKAVLYGSRAKGTFRNGSNIDLSLFAHIRNADVIDHIRRVGVAFYEKPAAASGAARNGEGQLRRK